MRALPDEPDHPLPGSDETAAAMQGRIDRLDDDARGTDYRLPDDFTVLDRDITN